MVMVAVAVTAKRHRRKSNRTESMAQPPIHRANVNVHQTILKASLPVHKNYGRKHVKY